MAIKLETLNHYRVERQSDPASELLHRNISLVVPVMNNAAVARLRQRQLHDLIIPQGEPGSISPSAETVQALETQDNLQRDLARRTLAVIIGLAELQEKVVFHRMTPDHMRAMESAFLRGDSTVMKRAFDRCMHGLKKRTDLPFPFLTDYFVSHRVSEIPHEALEQHGQKTQVKRDLTLGQEAVLELISGRTLSPSMKEPKPVSMNGNGYKPGDVKLLERVR